MGPQLLCVAPVRGSAGTDTGPSARGLAVRRPEEGLAAGLGCRQPRALEQQMGLASFKINLILLG